MLSRTFAVSRTVSRRVLCSGKRAYSDHAPEGEHDAEGFPISKSENIFNVYTGTFFGVVASIFGYQYVNSKYKDSHDGEPILSIFKKGSTAEQLKANFEQYRSGVAHREELHTMFADTPVRNLDTVITHVTELPGKVQCFGGNAQFNTIQDWEAVGPRKQKENPFK